MTLEIPSLAENRLLAALPWPLAEQVALELEPLVLVQGRTLVERSGFIDTIYFPTSSMISMIVELENGNTVESLTVGKDGFVETAAFFGLPRTTMKGIVQIPGGALAMRNGSFQKFLDNPPFRTIMGAYVEKAIALLAQSAACLAFHPLEQRLARWLLEVRERIALDELQLTHEFLAQMLGVRRPSATLAVNAMVRAGLIEQGRGRIRIVNPNGLMQASCECYRTLRTYRDA